MNWKDSKIPGQSAWWRWYRRERVALDIRQFRADSRNRDYAGMLHWDSHCIGVNSCEVRMREGPCTK